MHRTRRALALAGVLTAGSAVLVPGLAWAAKQPQSPTTGQPGAADNVACGTTNGGAEPGHASSSTGSPFNEPSSTGGNHYAGNGTSATTANSSAAQSQYDIACANQPTK